MAQLEAVQACYSMTIQMLMLFGAYADKHIAYYSEGQRQLIKDLRGISLLSAENLQDGELCQQTSA